MPVRIRLRRIGAKKQPSYRFVVADSAAPRSGRFLEILGHYNPRKNPIEMSVDQEKVKKWLKRGAQPSDTVARLLARIGLFDETKVPRRKPREARKGKTAS